MAAALFYAGSGAAFCGVTAGWWLGMLHAEPRLLHVTAPGRRRSLREVRVHRRRRFERVWHKRFPVTPPAQTLLDIALDEVEAVLGRGKPGSAALRVALDCHRPELAKTRSTLEEKFLLLCEHYSLPPPGVNVWIGGWLVDAAWFDQRVVVELDGHAAHGTSASQEADHRRDLELRAAGYTVVRYTWQQVTETPELVLADLRPLLGL